MATRPNNRRQRGVTLIELLVALGIGSILMIGAITVYMQSRTAFTVNDSLARLQENARLALDVMEPEIRMANYWGLSTRNNRITNQAGPADPTPPGLGVGNDCGPNWTINLAFDITGTNGVYPWGAACSGAFGGAAQPGADTLELRRVQEDPVALPLNANTIYVQSDRFMAPALFRGAPPMPLPGTQIHPLIVRGFYVSPTSTVSRGATPTRPASIIPSLRMKNLVFAGGGPTIQDQELVPGVEDMQIEFGVDTTVPGAVGRGTVDRYVSTNDPILNPASPLFIPTAEILAVRLWLRVRADFPETGYLNNTNYVYADQNFTPNDGFRRLLVSKTIYMRNTVPGV